MSSCLSNLKRLQLLDDEEQNSMQNDEAEAKEDDEEQEDDDDDGEKMLFEGKYLTREQQMILQHAANIGDKVVINAFAGCAKTTTLRALVQYKCKTLDPEDKRKFLYIVFNDAMAALARSNFRVDEDEEMDRIVDVRTYHSLALAYFRHSLEQRNIVIEEGTEFDFQDEGSAFGLYKEVHKTLIATMKRFTQDPSTEFMEPQPCHTKEGFTPLSASSNSSGGSSNSSGGGSESEQQQQQPIVITEAMLTDKEKLDLRNARKIWHDVVNARRRYERLNVETDKLQQYIELSHDFTLKWFCLNAQDAEQYIQERYHDILVDEGQDIQRPLMAWLLEHVRNLAVYFVGDTFQSIYAFTGAHDAIEHASAHADAKLFRLTKSFRFGSAIAAAATALLHSSLLLGRDVHIQGNDAQRGPGTVHALPREATAEIIHEVVRAVHARTGTTRIAVLSRTNDPAMVAAVTLYKKGYHVRLEGRLAKFVEKALDILKKYKNDAQVLEKIMEFKRYALMQEKRQLVWRRNVLAGAEVPPVSSGYEERGFVQGQLRLNEQQAFEQAVLEHAHGYLRPTYDLYLGMHQQSRAKTVPANTVEITVCTVHAAKGSEWDTVIMLDDFPELDLCMKARLGLLTMDQYISMQQQRIGVENSNQAITHTTLMDFYRSRNAVPLKQEIHLYYVAMTRAKTHLFINAPTALVTNATVVAPTLQLSNEAARLSALLRPTSMPRDERGKGGGSGAAAGGGALKRVRIQ